MIAAPPYDAETIAALEAQTAALLDVFKTYGAERIEPAIVQPADAFLDRMGEELRRRTYVFTGPDGTELCLRPDLTIPTCQAYLARVPECRPRHEALLRGPRLPPRPQNARPARPKFPSRRRKHHGGQSRGGRRRSADPHRQRARANRA